MNHPGRSEGPLVHLIKARPWPLSDEGKITSDGKRAADTWTPVRAPGFQAHILNVDDLLFLQILGTKILFLCNNQKMCGLAFQFALNWL